MGEEQPPTVESPEEATPGGVQVPPDAELWESRFRYLLADFENYRRRAERERESLRREARASLLQRLLPVQDALEKAVEAGHRLPEGHPMRAGIELLQQEWASLLGMEGVKPVARVGEAFRADDHEAIDESVSTPEHPDGTICEVVQQGYRSPGGLLRPAKVVVARDPATASSVTESASAEATKE